MSDRTLFLTEFGSVLYGTQTPSSDTDYKGIFFPESTDVYFQRSGVSLNTSTGKQSSKNSKNDVDKEMLTLHGFIKLANEGQTMIYDMLFAPKKHWINTSDVWEDIIANREKLLSKKMSAFSGYCVHQASKYGIKGSRIFSVEKSISFLKELDFNEKMKFRWREIKSFVDEYNKVKFNSIKKDGTEDKFVNIVQCRHPSGVMEDHLEVNGRKFSQNMKIKEVVMILQKIYDNYGERAQLARKNEGIDWKALSHAVRVCSEGIELMNTGFITFPRPDAPLLLKIKTGQMPYEQVAELIECGLLELNESIKTTRVPSGFPVRFWEEFVSDKYTEEFCEQIGKYCI